MIHTYTGRYITCDEPGCTVQTGGICATCHGGERGMPFAHWDSWSVDGKHFCPFHSKDPEHAAAALVRAEQARKDAERAGRVDLLAALQASIERRAESQTEKEQEN